MLLNSVSVSFFSTLTVVVWDVDDAYMPWGHPLICGNIRSKWMYLSGLPIFSILVLLLLCSAGSPCIYQAHCLCDLPFAHPTANSCPVDCCQHIQTKGEYVWSFNIFSSNSPCLLDLRHKWLVQDNVKLVLWGEKRYRKFRIKRGGELRGTVFGMLDKLDIRCPGAADATFLCSFKFTDKSHGWLKPPITVNCGPSQ